MRSVRGWTETMPAATLITYTGRRGSRSARPNPIRSARLLLAGRGERPLPVRSIRWVDANLAGLDLVGLGDPQRQHSVVERRRCLVRLEPVWKCDRAADDAASDLVNEEVALLLLPILGVLAADRERSVLNGDVDVLRLQSGKLRVDDELVCGHRDVDRQCAAVDAGRAPPDGPHEAVFEETIHRLAKRKQLAERRRTARNRHDSNLLLRWMICPPGERFRARSNARTLTITLSRGLNSPRRIPRCRSVLAVPSDRCEARCPQSRPSATPSRRLRSRVPRSSWRSSKGGWVSRTRRASTSWRSS